MQRYCQLAGGRGILCRHAHSFLCYITRFCVIDCNRSIVWFIMRPSSLGGGRILRRILSARLSVCPSVPLLSVTWRHLANYNDTHVLLGTRRGPHIVRPSRPHKFLFESVVVYSVFLSRVDRHAMHTERDIDLANVSVFPTCCSN